MSTHNIGFYEDLTKIIFKLSSNIIKYAPYNFLLLNAIMKLIYVLCSDRIAVKYRSDLTQFNSHEKNLLLSFGNNKDAYKPMH